MGSVKRVGPSSITVSSVSVLGLLKVQRPTKGN